MRVHAAFDGWWFAVPASEPRQVKAGDEYDVERVRGPFPTREEAEWHTYYDNLPGYWEHGLTVWADHCLGCGAFAKVLAFDNAPYGWAWRVTECKNCGVIDSREREENMKDRSKELLIRGTVMVTGSVLAGAFLAGCGKMSEPFKDAPRGESNTSPADTITFPDGFSNVATKCDHNNRVYVLFKGDQAYGSLAVVPDAEGC